MECYICMDVGEGLLVDLCACRNLYVHSACLKRWILDTHNTHCSICREPFRGVVQRMRPVEWRRKRKHIFMTTASFLCMVIVTVHIAIDVVSHASGTAGIMASISFVTFLGLLEVWWVVHALSVGLMSHAQHQRVIDVSHLDDFALRA